jgi:hypothetical protein
MKSDNYELEPEELAQKYVPEEYELDHPWALGRSTVSSGRTEKVMFTIQTKVASLEGDTIQAVQAELGDEISKTDLREAALILAYSQPKKLSKILSEWGAEHA